MLAASQVNTGYLQTRLMDSLLRCHHPECQQLVTVPLSLYVCNCGPIKFESGDVSLVFVEK